MERPTPIPNPQTDPAGFTAHIMMLYLVAFVLILLSFYFNHVAIFAAYRYRMTRTLWHGIRATVLEANQSVWGCTSRNGGQGQNASGRLYRSQWIERWGKETALKLDAEIRSGYETFKSLVGEFPCDAQPGGHLYVAHREKKMDFLRNEGDRVQREIVGYVQLSDAAMKSTRIIADSVAQWKGAVDGARSERAQ